MIFLWYWEVSYSKILSSTIRLFQAVQCTYTTSHQVKKPRLVTWMGDRGHTVPKTVWNSVYKLHELVADGADAMEYVLYTYVWLLLYLAQKPDIFRCICANRDRLGFYAGTETVQQWNHSLFSGVYYMIMKNFQRHYNSNRAPFGLSYHPAW